MVCTEEFIRRLRKIWACEFEDVKFVLTQ